MTTFATLKSRIADDLRRSDLTTQINSAVLDAVKRWEGERFWFNENRLRLDTVASTEYYAIPATLRNTDGSALDTYTDLIEIDSITILDDSESYPLQDRSHQWLDAYQSPAATYTGTPDYYGIYGNQIRIGPIPDASYPLTISGLLRLAPLSADDDSNAWTTEAEALIRNQAIAELCRFPLRDPEGFQLANGGVQDALALLKDKTGNKVSTGRIRPWGYT